MLSLSHFPQAYDYADTIFGYFQIDNNCNLQIKWQTEMKQANGILKNDQN